MAVAALAGCVNYTSSQVVAFVGGSTAAIGITAVVVSDDVGGAYGPAAAVVVLIPVILITVGGLIGMGVYDSPAEEAQQRARSEAAEEARQRAVAEEVALRAARDHAWSLTKEARAAAGHDDCIRVRAIASEVVALDADFYATVFASDVGTARCLTLPR